MSLHLGIPVQICEFLVKAYSQLDMITVCTDLLIFHDQGHKIRLYGCCQLFFQCFIIDLVCHEVFLGEECDQIIVVWMFICQNLHPFQNIQNLIFCGPGRRIDSVSYRAFWNGNFLCGFFQICADPALKLVSLPGRLFQQDLIFDGIGLRIVFCSFKGSSVFNGIYDRTPYCCIGSLSSISLFNSYFSCSFLDICTDPASKFIAFSYRI